MHVYRVSKCKFISNLSGAGAANFGGRWNSKGVYVLYTAQSPSLALLESVVHLSSIPMEGYCLATLDVPDDLMRIIPTKDLPPGWSAYPAPGLLTAIGDQFIRENKYLVLQLPSAVMPEESIFLVNPGHKAFDKVRIIEIKPIAFDQRLLTK